MKPNDQEFLSLTLKVIIWQYRCYFLLMYYFRIQEKKKWQYFITQNLCLFSTAKYYLSTTKAHEIDGLVQERCNSIANALELHISYTNPSKW